MFKQGDTLIYSDIYPVRFERMINPTRVMVSEDGYFFTVRRDQLRLPTYPKRIKRAAQ